MDVLTPGSATSRAPGVNFTDPMATDVENDSIVGVSQLTDGQLNYVPMDNQIDTYPNGQEHTENGNPSMPLNTSGVNQQ
jgi:hypothetical protein